MAAASSSTSTGTPKAGQSIGKYRLVRELGERVPHTFAGAVTSIIGESELVVVEILSLPEASQEAMESFARRARRLSLVRHPNLARMREVLVLKDRVAIATDFVEGEVLADLLAEDAGKKLGLVERLRVLADVLSGLSSIHVAPELSSAADKEGRPAIHGALDPHSIVVGTDGSARLVHLVRVPAISGKSYVEAARYTAPELLLGDETSGVRADLYAVGVLLWESLTGQRLFEETDEKAVLARQLAGPLPLATVPDDAPWAKPLIDVTARALDVDPEKRHASAAELAGALRLAVQARLAPASRVGAAVASIAKEKIAARVAWKPAKTIGIARSVKLGGAPPVKAAPKVEAKAKAETKTESTPEKSADATQTTKPDDLESTEKKPVPAIARGGTTQKGLGGKTTQKGLGLPSLAVEDEEVDETKRVEIDSIADDDLFVEDETQEMAALPKPSKAPASSVKKSMPPPLRPKSIAPPLPPAASSSPNVASVTPPPAVVTPAVVTPPVEITSAPEPGPSEPIATIAPVVTPAMTDMPSAPAVHAVAATDSKIEVIPPPDDPQKKKRRAIVIGVVGGAALLLLIGVVKHATKGDDTPAKSTTAVKPTATVQAPPPPATATQVETAAAATASAPPADTFVAEPVPTHEATPTEGESTTPPPSNPTESHPVISHSTNPGVQSSHPAAPAKTHKRPPHSSYEPEGI